MDELAKVNINGKEYHLKDETARQGSGGTDGYSFFYADAEIPYPMDEGTLFFVKFSKLSNEGAGIKAGDLVIASNGTLCKVVEVAHGSSRVALFSIASIGGSGNDSGGNVDFQVGETLKLENGILSVNTTDSMEQDNTLPITSAGVFATVGNIETLLKTI